MRRSTSIPTQFEYERSHYLEHVGSVSGGGGGIHFYYCTSHGRINVSRERWMYKCWTEFFSCIFYFYSALKDFVHCATNWLLCLNKLVYFFFSICSICFARSFSPFFRPCTRYECAREDYICVYVLSNHFTIHLKNSKAFVRASEISFESLAYSTFGVSLPYFCAICILCTRKLILMVGEVNFYFVVVVTTTTNLYRKQWKSIRWNVFNPVMEKW